VAQPRKKTYKDLLITYKAPKFDTDSSEDDDMLPQVPFKQKQKLSSGK